MYTTPNSLGKKPIRHRRSGNKSFKKTKPISPEIIPGSKAYSQYVKNFWKNKKTAPIIPIPTVKSIPFSDLIIDQKNLKTSTNEDILVNYSKEDLLPVDKKAFKLEAKRRGLIRETKFIAPIVETSIQTKDNEPIASETGTYVKEVDSTIPDNFIEAAAATDNKLLKYGILGIGFYILYDSFLKKGIK